jgi:hypothetical protein
MYVSTWKGSKAHPFTLISAETNPLYQVVTSRMGVSFWWQGGNACVWQAGLWDHIRRLAGPISGLWSVDLDKGEKSQTPLLWLRRLLICNFKSCLQFYIHVSLPRCLSYLKSVGWGCFEKAGWFPSAFGRKLQGQEGGWAAERWVWLRGWHLWEEGKGAERGELRWGEKEYFLLYAELGVHSRKNTVLRVTQT